MTRKVIALIATSLVVSTMSTTALAVSKRTEAVAERDVRTLLRLLDKDENGVVSKDEFLQFLGQTFDRLDVNKSGTLEHREVHGISTAFPVSKRTEAVAEKDVRTLLRLIDKDKNGVVSKGEFLQFVGHAFDRLDVDKSGALEPKELRQLTKPSWAVPDCIHVTFPECSGEE